MLLGKRQRPPIKRTTSMTGITFDLSNNTECDDGDKSQQQFDPNNNSCQGLDQRFMVAVSPRTRTSQRRNSADFVETAHFLRACSLCKRRLIPGRDIYMYRGDSAFCSLECRQQQMNQDERKEKCSLMASKKEVSSVATGSEVVSTKGETVAAV